MKEFKKLYTGTVSALLTLAAFFFMFSSCSNVDEPETEAVSKNVEMTIEVSSGERIGTRTNLDEGENSMTCTWAADEQLLVTDVQGVKKGILDIVTSDIGKGKAQFTGTISSVTNGEKINLIYLGAGKDLNAITESTVEMDFTSQDGLAASLNKGDVMSKQTSVIVNDGKVVPSETVILSKQLAIGHFKMVLPNGETVTDGMLVISGKDVYGKATLSLANGEIVSKTESAITIVNTDGDIYVNLVPGDQVTPTFKLTAVDGTEYEGTLTAKKIEAGDFIRASENVGVPVTMTKINKIDHSKNPLLKWAETNLVDKGAEKSEFAASINDGGSLYQWGRNHGFTDYKDALGTYNSGNGTYSYGTYNKSYATGMGIWNTAGDDRVSLRYTGVTQIQNNKTLFMMSTENESSSNDYWCFSDNGGSNWYERAEKCGYTSPNPCPEGWRLPTQADVAEILPTQGITTTSNLSNLLENKIELKEINGVCKYAIRWNIETQQGKKTLKIRVLVVPDNFIESQLGTINWDNNNDIVTRYFSATGAIEGMYHLHIMQLGNTKYNYPIARPMPFGTWIATAEQNSYGAIWVSYKNIIDAGQTYEGAYWISDVKQIFRFRDNSENVFGADNRNSFFGFSNQPAYNAFAIRCVKE